MVPRAQTAEWDQTWSKFCSRGSLVWPSPQVSQKSKSAVGRSVHLSCFFIKFWRENKTDLKMSTCRHFSRFDFFQQVVGLVQNFTYCTFDLNLLPGPWKLRFTHNSHWDYCWACHKNKKSHLEYSLKMVTPEICLIVIYIFYLGLIHLCVVH